MARGKCDELKDFIDYSVSKGISKDQVKKMLIQSGWPEEVIEGMFVKKGAKSGELLTAGNNAIKLVNLTKAFGSNVVLDEVNLAIKPGEIFGIIGLSGSGKTTLLNTIVGFVEPDQGEVVINSGKDTGDYLISLHPHQVKSMFGFAAQHPSFYNMLTVDENMTHFASLYNISKAARKKRCNELIGLVGLEKAKNVLGQNLSGGMQKRLDIACSLVHTPKILILDEPTSDLDPVSREDMWELIKQINSQGTTIILASHFVNELEVLCDRFAILHEAKIRKVGTPDELKESYSKNYEITLETKSRKYESLARLLKSKRQLQVHSTKETKSFLTIYTQNPEHTLYEIARAIASSNEKIVDIAVNKPTIRELFESVVKK